MGLAINDDREPVDDEAAAARIRAMTYGEVKLALQHYSDACFRGEGHGQTFREWLQERETHRIRNEYRGKP
jgi:hypothetical protein